MSDAIDCPRCARHKAAAERWKAFARYKYCEALRLGDRLEDLRRLVPWGVTSPSTYAVPSFRGGKGEP